MKKILLNKICLFLFSLGLFVLPLIFQVVSSRPTSDFESDSSYQSRCSSCDYHESTSHGTMFSSRLQAYSNSQETSPATRSFSHRTKPTSTSTYAPWSVVYVEHRMIPVLFAKNNREHFKKLK